MENDKSDKSHRILIGVTAVGSGGTVLIAIAGFIALFTDNLPTAARMRSVFNDECTKMAIATAANVDESAQKIAATLINFRKSPEATRNQIYRDALKQADDKGYVYKPEQHYLIPDLWKGKGRWLLTGEERQIAEGCFAKHREEDLYSLMHLVLSDNKMVTELKRKEAHDVVIYDQTIVPQASRKSAFDSTEYDMTEIVGDYLIGYKRATRHLTPYDKIAIIGAHVDELRHEHTPR